MEYPKSLNYYCMPYKLIYINYLIEYANFDGKNKQKQNEKHIRLTKFVEKHVNKLNR